MCCWRIEEKRKAKKEMPRVYSIRQVEIMNDKYVTILIIQLLQSRSKIDDYFLDDGNGYHLTKTVLKASLKLSVSSLEFNECFLNDSRGVIGGGSGGFRESC